MKNIFKTSKSKTFHLPPSTSRGGFTLIETLVAVFIFSLALVALMTIVAKGVFATASARNQMIAHYLAQEGIEFARNIRDTNFLTGTMWTGDLDISTCRIGGDGCYLDRNDRTFKPCGGSCPLSLGAAYNNDSIGTLTGYERKIFFEEIEPGTEIRLTSQVVWNDGTIPRAVTLHENLLKWVSP